jgi:hypothetical protein
MPHVTPPGFEPGPPAPLLIACISQKVRTKGEGPEASHLVSEDGVEGAILGGPAYPYLEVVGDKGICICILNVQTQTCYGEG